MLSDLQVTLSDLQVTLSDLQVTLSDLQVTPSDLQVTPSDPQVTLSDLQVTPSDPQVTLSGRFLQSGAYDMSQPGKYTVRVGGGLQDVIRDGTRPPRPRDRFQPAKLSCNEVTLDVVKGQVAPKVNY